MEGHSLISADILASYAADAALEIDGVSRLVEGTRPRHHGVKITNDRRRRRGRAPSRRRLGGQHPGRRRRRADPRGRVPRPDGRPHAGDGRRRRRRHRPAAGRRPDVPSRVAGLTRGTIGTAPSVCRECVWWQSRGNKTASKERWIERVEEESGEWGTIYYDDDGSVLGSMQYGPLGLLPARGRPSGRPAVGRRRARHLRVPDRRRSGVGREVALPRRDRRGARPGRQGARGVRLPLSRARVDRGRGSSSTARCSRATSSRTSAS